MQLKADYLQYLIFTLRILDVPTVKLNKALLRQREYIINVKGSPGGQLKR